MVGGPIRRRSSLLRVLVANAPVDTTCAVHDRHGVERLHLSIYGLGVFVPLACDEAEQ